MKATFFIAALLSFQVLTKCDDVVSIFPSLPVSATLSENSVCVAESVMYLEELNNMTMWAMKMWDSTAKSVEGILAGNTYQMGHFHQCFTETQAPFATQYCFAKIIAHTPNRKLESSNAIIERLNLPADRSRDNKDYVKVAWCVPASCSPSDLEQSLSRYLKTLNTSLSDKGVTYSAQILESECQTNEARKFDTLDIAFCLVSGFLVIFVIYATVYDYRIEESSEPTNDRMHQFVMAFSARRNLLSLPKTEESGEGLAALHGLRTLSCIFLIGLHRFAILALVGILQNLDYVENLYQGKEAWKFVLYHGDVPVDTFFTFSGILTAYGFFKAYDKKKSQPWKLIFLRYMRLTPVYMYVLFYYATLYYYTGYGPLWKREITSQKILCRQNWYLNLFYLQNYIRDSSREVCMQHTWSLSCDFHFFIAGLLVCILIARNKKLGLWLLFGLTAASMLATFAKVYIEERPALYLLYPKFLEDPEFQATYTKSHLRAAPYFIGLYAGYLYYKYHDSKKRMNLMHSLIVFVSSMAVLITVLKLAGIFYDQYREYNAFESATYAALNRAVWSVGILGIVFVCIYGSFAPLNRFLFWKGWIPLSKLTYAAFIIHLHIQLRSMAMATSSITFDFVNLSMEVIGDCVVAFLAGLVLYILVETPIRIVSKMLLVPNTNSKIREISNGNATNCNKAKLN